MRKYFSLRRLGIVAAGLVWLVLTAQGGNGKPKLIVFGFNSLGVDPHVVSTLRAMLEAELDAVGKVQLVAPPPDRTEELVANCNGANSCLANVGKLLDVQQLVVGQITQVGSHYRIAVQLLNVADGQLIREIVRDETELAALSPAVRLAAQKLLDLEPRSTRPELLPPPSEVYFYRLTAIKPILDRHEVAALVGDSAQETRPLIRGLSPGRHLIHYDIGRGRRYVAPFIVNPGKNIITLKFDLIELPELTSRIELRSGQSTRIDRQFDYELSDDRLVARHYITIIRLDHQLVPAVRETDPLTYRLAWQLIINGETASENVIQRLVDYKKPSGAEMTLFSDALHMFSLAYRLNAYTATVDLEGSFTDFDRY